jgi:hypothetical protein
MYVLNFLKVSSLEVYLINFASTTAFFPFRLYGLLTLISHIIILYEL